MRSRTVATPCLKPTEPEARRGRYRTREGPGASSWRARVPPVRTRAGCCFRLRAAPGSATSPTAAFARKAIGVLSRPRSKERSQASSAAGGGGDPVGRSPQPATASEKPLEAYAAARGTSPPLAFQGPIKDGGARVSLCMERSGERKRGSGDHTAAFARSAFDEARPKPVRRAAVRALDQRRSVRNLPACSWLLTI